jgi:broad specificity phosphatase PhoE
VLETAEIVVSKLPSDIRWSLATEHLIVKQNWGNVTIHNRTEIEKERYRAGVLRYQFPGGESGAEMLFRFDLFARDLKQRMAASLPGQTLIITHGFEFRLLLKSLLRWTEEYFESLAHPHHCELKRLACHDGEFLLLDEMKVHDLSKNPNFIHRQPNK